jgi:hypothetical protein
MDVHNNNIWLVEAIARAATANAWPRVDVKSGNTGPGVNGGLQGTVKSPMNKGRAYKIPGVGLAGDWPGAWTQTYAQVDTEAGPRGFDKNYFVQQVAGLTQIAGELMLVDPRVIDLGWGELKSAIVALKDTGLLDQYVAAFRHVEAGARDKGAIALKDLSTSVATRVPATDRAAITKLVDTQLAKLT